MTKPKYDSWGELESAALEAEILEMLGKHDAVRPPKSEQKLPSVVVPEPAALIQDLTEEERKATPFWKNWEEHINDPEKDRESIPARPSARRKS